MPMTQLLEVKLFALAYDTKNNDKLEEWCMTNRKAMLF